tara:strand:- start:1969 stop:2571 length:603 start_codon:yes stop_codon:yes gene_type:complete
MAEVGYIRVSSVDQNTARQLDGVHLDKKYIDKMSGANTKRPELIKCLDFVREGDTLHCHSMRRLARNLGDLEKLIDALTSRGVKVHFHTESLIFTGQDDAMARLLLHVIGAVSQFERATIKERQMQGIIQARKAGKHLGRKDKLSLSQKRELIALVDADGDKTKIAEKFGISRPTLYKILKDRKAGKIPGLAEAQLELMI